MKVILLKDIKGFGRKNEIKEVSDGHARNMLIPKGFAKLATESELSKLENLKKGVQKKKEEIVVLAKSVDSKEFSFVLKADAKGIAFGSVTKNDIKNALAKEGFEIHDVNLEKPIKNIGSHEVEVVFDFGVIASVKIIVIAEK